METTATWRGGSGSSGQLFDQSRWYDPASNVSSLATTFGAVNAPTSEVQNFCYDEQSRLVWAGNSGSQPGAGNGTCGSQSLSHGLSGASYNNSFVSTHLGQLWQGPLGGSNTSSQYLYCTSAPHQLSGLYSSGATCANKSGQVYKSSTDAWGNVTSRTYQGTSTTLAYDALDHLVKWSGGSGNNEFYVYDASGTRVLRRATNGGTTTLTTYPFGIEDHTYSGDGTLQSNTYYYSLAGRLIGELTGSPTPTQTNLFLTDALGSVVDTFSNIAGSASVLGSQVYGPYGTQRYQQGSMGTTKGFTGQYADATGLDYYNARYYDPVVGMFLSADTVQGNLQGMNPYGYVGGNPETRSDPTGHRQMCPPDGCGSGGSPNGHGTGRGPVDTCYALDDCSGGGGVIPSPNNTQLQHDATHYFHGTKPTFLNSGLQGLLYLYLYDHHALVMQEATDWAVLEQLWQEAEAILVQQGIDWNASGAMELLHEKLIALTVPLLIMYTGGGFDHHVDLAGSIDGVGADGGGVDPSGNTSDGSGDTSGGFCSFTPQTLVATTKGEQPIGTLQVGEKVWAYNPTTHKMDLESVLHIWIHQDNDLVDLTITTTTTVRHGSALTTIRTREVIHTNKKHPFFTIEQGFLAVSHITLGMHLLRADGRVGVVTGWKVVAGTKTMYNLEVQQDHTFTVGVGMWVVHNSGGCGGVPSDTITNTSQLDESFPQQLQYDGMVQGGRSGGNRPRFGTPNSYAQTTGGHALIYDNQGLLLYDIDGNRVKMVIWDQAPDGNLYSRDVKLRGSVPQSWLDLLP